MKNNKKGFTLVELVIVVAVMAVLVAVAIPTVSSIVGTAEDAVTKSNARTIESMIKLYMADNEATVSADNIDKALTEANLGIDGETYVYDDATGKVTSGTAASGTSQYLITFDIDGKDKTGALDTVKVEQGKAATNNP